jgi:hypothetical protein
MSVENWGAGIVANSTSTQVVPLPVFPVSLEEEPTVLGKLLSVTCADPVVCLHPPRFGESGTKRSILARSENIVPLSCLNILTRAGDTQLFPPWLHLPSQLF